MFRKNSCFHVAHIGASSISSYSSGDNSSACFSTDERISNSGISFKLLPLVPFFFIEKIIFMRQKHVLNGHLKFCASFGEFFNILQVALKILKNVDDRRLLLRLKPDMKINSIHAYCMAMVVTIQ